MVPDVEMVKSKDARDESTFGLWVEILFDTLIVQSGLHA